MSNTHNSTRVTSVATDATPVIVNTKYGPIEYAEYGEGPAIVAIHGAMGGYDQSLILARTIGGDGYRYIAVSRPGYLGTPLASGKTYEQQSDLCAALLDELGIETALVMAVSGGGPCAMQFALRHSERCRGLVLASTCGKVVNTPIPFSFKLMTLMLRIPALAKGIERKASGNIEQAASRSIPDPEVRARTMEDPEAGPLFTALLKSTRYRMRDRIKGTENDIALTRTTNYPLEKIAVPTLIVHGTADKMVPYEVHAKALESRIPNAELLTIEGGEHVSIFTHRDIVRNRVTRFIQEHSSASACSV